jgi:hypothetical protein
MVIRNSNINNRTILALNHLIEMELPAREAFKLMLISNEISTLVKIKMKAEKKIFEKYSIKDEYGNYMSAKDDQGNIIENSTKVNDIDGFNKEMEDLNSIENENSLSLIKFDDLKLDKIRPIDLMPLEFIFEL